MWGITGGVSVACAAVGARLGSAEIAKFAFEACSNLAMKSIEAADRSDYSGLVRLVGGTRYMMQFNFDFDTIFFCLSHVYRICYIYIFLYSICIHYM